MSPARRWWLLFAAATAAVILAMAVVTAVVLRLERDERRARQATAHQEALRLSLWRMDSWLAPRLAAESARPYFEYAAYYPQERSYTRLLNEIQAGEVLTPSPLLLSESDLFPLYFQIDDGGRITSPQVPEGSLRDLAEATLFDGQTIAKRRHDLEAIKPCLRSNVQPARVAAAIACVTEMANAPVVPPEPAYTGTLEQPRQLEWSKLERNRRAQSSAEAQVAQTWLSPQMDDSEPAPIVTVGPLVPLWLEEPATGDEQRRLAFVRRVGLSSGEVMQGFMVDWPGLRAVLLEQIDDLFPAAALTPAAIADPAPTALATIPAALAVTSPSLPATAALTPARIILLIMWAVVLAAIAAAALGLRASIAYGERRSRFASAVTHELRTPLTTFQMYSEMLADGMITDEPRRRSYLQTLRQESARLSSLVENVLAYARLERGNGTRRRQVDAAAMLAPLIPRLEQRCADAGLTLVGPEAIPAETIVDADPEAIGQILLNLVDNACKYAAGGDDRRVHLEVARRAGALAITVRDHGPGVPARRATAIFAPFERGRDGDAALATPGIGLGLALCRGLAQDLGGDVRLKENGASGACFELVLPVAV